MKKKTLKAILILFAILLATLIGVTGFSTWMEKRSVDAKIAAIQESVNLGDDIYSARDVLITNGFYVSRVVDPTARGENLSCVVTLNDHDYLDGLEYAIETNLRPWRNRIHYHMVIRADRDGTIKKIEPR